MSSKMPHADVARILANLKYRYQDQTKRDITNALSLYRNLTPQVDHYVFPDGSSRDLICLNGTVPVNYRGSVYNIPCCLWITETHPYNAPLCYVRPTSDMTIKVSKHVDSNGRIYLPYLSDWKANTNDLLGVIQVMIIVFGETPPVYSKPRQPGGSVEQTANNNSPYPTTGFQPMPRVGPPMPGQPPNTTNPPAYPQYPPISQNTYPYGSPYANSAGQSNAGANPYPVPSSTAANPFSAAGYPAYPNASQNSSQTSGSLSPNSLNSGTITEEHIRASLLSAVEDKLKHKTREKMAQFHAEIDVLKKTKDDLNKGKVRLEEVVSKIDKEMAEMNECKSKMKEKIEQCSDQIEKNSNKDVKIDDAFGPTQALYKQLLNAFSEENAIVDAIYYCGESLRKGCIDLETFLKVVRELSRRQFMLRALMRVCREKAGLPV